MVRDERLFIDGIKTRVAQLISCGVWQGVDLARFDSWFDQFRRHNCEFLGACLVDSLIFRSRGQVEALLRSIFSSHELLGGRYSSDNDLINALALGKDPGVRLCPVIRMDQPPTKSGMYVLRLLSKMMRIRGTWLKWPQALESEPSTVHTIILVDDFCGTGTQFDEFVKFSGFNKFMNERPDCRIVYATVAAHLDGLTSAKMKSPRIEIIAGETLSSDDHFFDGTSLGRLADSSIALALQNQYEALASKVGLGVKSVSPYGFLDQALTYAFAHGTPNNTLPVFWFQNEQWTPLVNR